MSGDDTRQDEENDDKLPIPTGDVMADAYIELRDEIVQERLASPGGPIKKAAKRKKKKVVKKKKVGQKKTKRLKPRK